MDTTTTTTTESAVNALGRFCLWLRDEGASEQSYRRAAVTGGALLRQLRARGSEPTVTDLDSVDIPAAWLDERTRLAEHGQWLTREEFAWPALMLQTFLRTHPASSRERLFDR